MKFILRSFSFAQIRKGSRVPSSRVPVATRSLLLDRLEVFVEGGVRFGSIYLSCCFSVADVLSCPPCLSVLTPMTGFLYMTAPSAAVVCIFIVWMTLVWVAALISCLLLQRLLANPFFLPAAIQKRILLRVELQERQIKEWNYMLISSTIQSPSEESFCFD